MLVLLLCFHGVISLTMTTRQTTHPHPLVRSHFTEEASEPIQMPPLSVLSQPVVAATYYFSSYRRQLNDDGQNLDISDRCEAADTRQGTCYDTADCIELGGVPMGKCPQEGVCCIFDVPCGGSTREVISYFRNPNFPEAFDREGTCKMKIAKQSDSVCQVRLDFLTFDVTRPTEGNCSQDMLVVSGQNENNLVPKICGLNSGHHYYIDVDDSGAISLHVTMVGNYQRKFDIKVTQVKCNTRESAPPHCLQYHRGTRGIIKSFNYDEAGPGFGYPNNLDYVICVRKEPGFCSITYQLNGEGRSVAPFAVGVLPGTTTAAIAAFTGPVTAECHDDYVLFTGIRVCSGRVTSGGLPNRPVREPNGTSTYILTDTTPGPFLVRFVSNGARNARGFNFSYKQNPCK